MRRFFVFFLIVMFLSGFALFTQKVYAMMHGDSDASFGSQELLDEDYERLGEEWMEQMMGNRHKAADEHIKDMMGEDFLKNMHIAMGKQSGNSNTYSMMPMMGMMMGTGMMGSKGYSPLFSGVHVVLGFVTWFAVVAFLISAARYFWKKAGK